METKWLKLIGLVADGVMVEWTGFIRMERVLSIDLGAMKVLIRM